MAMAESGVVQTTPAVKLSELVATLALVSDLGMGRPVERVLRQTVIAMRLADVTGVGDEVRTATYYTSLLTWVGCAADTSDLAELFGDETALFADTHDGDLAGVRLAAFMFRRLARGQSPVRGMTVAGHFVATGGKSVQTVMESHCQSTAELADRLGLGDDVRRPLRAGVRALGRARRAGSRRRRRPRARGAARPPRRLHRVVPLLERRPAGGVGGGSRPQRLAVRSRARGPASPPTTTKWSPASTRSRRGTR